MLVLDLGDVDISEVTLNLLKEYLAKQSDRLKPSSLWHRIRFVRSLFRFAYEETYLSAILLLNCVSQKWRSGYSDSFKDLLSDLTRERGLLEFLLCFRG
ncbi:hypothetical protein [Paenibacillus illinoisensis]|uniref:hypothetical protein n=1 Tax=Paenibacillus illinoisensis TaxID=59845 RepID=UPI001FECD28F|nr:hypothetical protein [Paenibacillus illinoisensis]